MEPRLRQPQSHRQIRDHGPVAAVVRVEEDEDRCVGGGETTGHAGKRHILTTGPSPDPENIEGNAESARVVGLMPWMDYEFQVIASNILGSGEPSMASHTVRTQQAGEVT